MPTFPRLDYKMKCHLPGNDLRLKAQRQLCIRSFSRHHSLFLIIRNWSRSAYIRTVRCESSKVTVINHGQYQRSFLAGISEAPSLHFNVQRFPMHITLGTTQQRTIYT